MKPIDRADWCSRAVSPSWLCERNETVFLGRLSSDQGFSLPEILFCTAVMTIVLCIGVPQTLSALRVYRVGADARAIAAQLTLARMRAAADFTHAGVSFNTSASPGSYAVKVWNKNTGTFQTEGAAEYLSPQVSFGFGAITTPAGGQSSIQQSTAVLFDSRGVAIDAGGAPTAAYSVYITDGQGTTLAVTVSLSGKIKIWQYIGTSWVAS